MRTKKFIQIVDVLCTFLSQLYTKIQLFSINYFLSSLSDPACLGADKVESTLAV